jgi:hypothetical protein
VWVREPLRHAGGETVTAHDPMHSNSRQGERLLVRVTAEAHEQRVLVEQRDAARERMHRRPHLKRLLSGLGDGNLALAPTLPADKEAEVPRV